MGAKARFETLSESTDLEMPATLLEKVCYAKVHDLLKSSDSNGRSKKVLTPSEIQLIKRSALLHIEFADVE